MVLVIFSAYLLILAVKYASNEATRFLLTIFFRSEQCNPECVIVLLSNDLVAIDLKSTGLPSYENPYAMDFQVTIVRFK